MGRVIQGQVGGRDIGLRVGRTLGNKVERRAVWAQEDSRFNSREPAEFKPCSQANTGPRRLVPVGQQKFTLGQ